MKTSVKLGGLVAAALIATSGAAFATDIAPYVTSSNGEVVMSNFGLCWRTNFWTPALAEQAGVNGLGCKCDKDVLPAAACQGAAPAAEPSAEKVTLAADTLFAFDSDRLSSDGQLVLDDLVSRLAGLDIEVILTTGYADRLGKPDYNQRLSEARANAVKDYLVFKGVNAGAIQTEGRGIDDPVVNCPNPSAKGEIKNQKQLIDCLAPNRRAVIEVIGTRSAK